MKPGRYNFTTVQGDTFHSEPVWKINTTPVNVTGYSALMQIKRAVDGTLIIELSSANGRIIVGTTDGKFTLNLTAAQTSALPMGNFVYDLQLTAPDGTVTTLLQGGFTINPQVSI